MKRSWIKAALTMVLLAAVLVTGCTSGNNKGKSGALSADDPVTFSWLVYDRVEGKVRDDWEIFKEIKEKTGVNIEFSIVGQEGLEEKRQIMIATNTATDFIQVSTQDGREHGPEKVFLNLKDYL